MNSALGNYIRYPRNIAAMIYRKSCFARAKETDVEGQEHNRTVARPQLCFKLWMMIVFTL